MIQKSTILLMQCCIQRIAYSGIVEGNKSNQIGPLLGTVKHMGKMFTGVCCFQS